MTNLKAMQSAISALDSGHWGHGIPEAYAILYEAIEQAKTQLQQREWVGLTPDETMILASATAGQSWCDESHLQRFSRAIERKLKEKNV